MRKILLTLALLGFWAPRPVWADFKGPGWRADWNHAECLDRAGNVVKTIQFEDSVEDALPSADRKYAAIFQHRAFTFYGPTCRELWRKKSTSRGAISSDGKYVVLAFSDPVEGGEGDEPTPCWIDVFNRKGVLLWRAQDNSINRDFECSERFHLSPNGRYGYGFRIPGSDTAYFFFDTAKKSTDSWRIPFEREVEIMNGQNSEAITNDGVFQIKRGDKILYEFKFQK